MRTYPGPRYALRRALHHTFVGLAVWRQNRVVGRAFLDPSQAGGSARIKLRPGPLQRRILPLVVIALLATLGAWRSGWLAPEPQPAPPRPPLPSLAVLPPEGGRPAVPAPAAVPAELPLPPIGRVLIACKRDRSLYVYRRNGDGWKKQAAFDMVFGRNAGDKADARDKRTPEGRYWITGMHAGPTKGTLYGALIFTLNYPKPGDLAEGKTGNGIWIHGMEAGRRADFTRGCLALGNADMVALADYADIGTPIVILPDTLAADPDRQVDWEGMRSEYPGIMAAHARRTVRDSVVRIGVLAAARAYMDKEKRDFPEVAEGGLSAADKTEIRERLGKWREDWSRRALDAYASHYAGDFRDKTGRDREIFLERKKGIFAAKTRIDMRMGELELASEGYGRARVTFRQEYLAEDEGGTQRSSDVKVMQLEHRPEGWLIVNE